ncbi:unnamed protein product [Choristocarpus tenellus]
MMYKTIQRVQFSTWCKSWMRTSTATVFIPAGEQGRSRRLPRGRLYSHHAASRPGVYDRMLL